MKTVVIGDIHGRSVWKLITHMEKPDRVIFVGDYFDSYDISTAEQVKNFKEIIKYKEDNPQIETIILIGNHCIHYFPEMGGDNGTSGFQYKMYYTISNEVDKNRHHLQMAYQFNDYLFTHAGVSSEFMDSAFKDGWSVDNIANDLNDLFKYKLRSFLFPPSALDPYGDDTYQTPIWIRPRSLMLANKDTLRDKVIQIVGHTSVSKIYIKGTSTGGRYYFIDCLDRVNEYLIIEENKLSVGKI